MRRKKAIITGGLILTGLLGLWGCGSPSSGSAETIGPVCESSMELQYAKNFTVDYYEGGCRLLTTTKDGRRFLVVPEGSEVPELSEQELSGQGTEKEEIVVLKEPMENLYLVASAAMDAFCELDALDAIRLSGQKADGWYIRKAREAMEQDRLIYAGKYNRPDYELILSENCQLAIENMMISHSPEVVEKFKSFGIPVMIDYSSYESHPLGRVEWIRFYGALLGKEAAAERVFSEQAEILARVAADEKTDKTAAFFFITSNGLVQVRHPSDYVPKMIRLAGGTYIFEEEEAAGGEALTRSTMNVSLEEFYQKAKEADFLIYNSSIDGGIESIEELLEKSGLFADFKAVKEGNVWCTTNDMYQQTMSIGYLIEDMHRMFLDEDGNEDKMRYLFQVN